MRSGTSAVAGGRRAATRRAGAGRTGTGSGCRSGTTSRGSTTSARDTGQLSLDGRVEGTSHSAERKLGGEGEVWVVGAGGVLQRFRREADEVLVAVRSDTGVYDEVDSSGG